jgi:hypothetical protein
MRGCGWRSISNSILKLLILACCSGLCFAQAPVPVTETATNSAKDSVELLRTLDKLVEQNHQLEKQNKDLMEQITALRALLTKQPALGVETVPKDAEPSLIGIEPAPELSQLSAVHPSSLDTGERQLSQPLAQQPTRPPLRARATTRTTRTWRPKRPTEIPLFLENSIPDADLSWVGVSMGS